MGLRDNLLASLDRLGQRWADEQRAITPTQMFGTGLDDWYAGNTAAGIQVTTEAAMRAAQGACIGLIADDIASLPVDFYTVLGEVKTPQPAPGWYDFPTANRWDTWPDHISQVVISLLSDGNAFVQGVPDVIDPSILDVLDPGAVSVRKDAGVKQYVVQGAREPYGDAQMMHIPWRKLPGRLRGLNPVESAKESTGLELAAREWASRFFSNGATLGGIIQVPPGVTMTKEGLDALREQFANKHVGKRKAFAFGVLTGGAQWVQNTVTPQDSALAPLWRQVLEEAARIYHIPPHLLASQESGASSYASVEHRSIEYVQHAIVPVVRRLEVAYSRLIPGAETYLKFNVNALLRGDIKTRAEAYRFFMEGKVLKPKDVAALEDFDPNMADEGWLETPNNNSRDPRFEDVGSLIRAGFDPASALQAVGLPPIKHLGALPVTVQGEDTPAAARSDPVVIVTGTESSPDVTRAADLMVADTRDRLGLVEVAMAEAHQRTVEDLTGYIEGRMAQVEARLEQQQAEAQAERDRLVAIPSVVREVTIRDDQGRPLKITERRGDRTIHKLVERDDAGRVVKVTEVAA